MSLRGPKWDPRTDDAIDRGLIDQEAAVKQHGAKAAVEQHGAKDLSDLCDIAPAA